MPAAQKPAYDGRDPSFFGAILSMRWLKPKQHHENMSKSDRKNPILNRVTSEYPTLTASGDGMSPTRTGD